RAAGCRRERTSGGVADGERGHHAEFTEGEKSDERERVHASEIGFAIRNVHRAPEDACAQRGPNAAERVARKALRGRSDGEERSANTHDKRAAENTRPAAPADLAEFVEEKKAPEDTKKAVGIPKQEGNAKTDVTNDDNHKHVNNSPEAAGKNSPDDQMLRAADVGADGGSAQDQCGKAPAREKNTHDHDERNRNKRNADGDEFRESFSNAEPRAYNE